jgi:UbiD family decarboxylase
VSPSEDRSNSYSRRCGRWIIEGRILPHIRREEGPFGEFTGHAVSKDERQVVEVTAITHRKNYIFQDVMRVTPNIN